MTGSEVCVTLPKANCKRQRFPTSSRDGVSNRVLPDKTTIRWPDGVFQSKSPSMPIWLKGQIVKCEGPKHLIQYKKGIMDTRQNPNEPGKSGGPEKQGGQEQDRERQERERQQREREKQAGGGQQGGGGGQKGGGQQGGR